MKDEDDAQDAARCDKYKSNQDDNDNGIILDVREADVLLGKGPMYQEFPGTLAMKAMVDETKARHDSATRSMKKFVTLEVLHRIKANGGRFLKRSDDGIGWIEVGQEQAHEKLAQTFRNHTKKQRRIQASAEPQSDRSS
mmetsp:Transcript_10743/g.30724  ORF Transcript_10743/g.30724 Transcript_10743/m.30724 type:complete len:139 (+) Transcript_10743:362-778(+)